MAYCAMKGCGSNQRGCNPNVIFHRFPANKKVRERWIELCESKNAINIQNARICSLHFGSSDYKRHLKYELLDLPVPHRLRALKDDALPTRRIPTLEDDPDNAASVSHNKKKEPSRLELLPETQARQSLQAMPIQVKEEPIDLGTNESSSGAINPIFLKCMYDEDTAEEKPTIKEEPLDERDMEIDSQRTMQSQWNPKSFEDGVEPKVKAIVDHTDITLCHALGSGSTNMEQRSNLKFLVKVGKGPTECHKLLQEAYGEKVMTRPQVFKWHRRFKSGHEEVEGDPKSGQPSTIKMGKNIDKVNQLV
ncbi:uncharacterized protein LOC143030376 [Oratosquilla oratoria]|uniref:uncharacterized protein LOC143030376 n=1 Tax=Oratosquilla oratoria TaxID=337810 RepID=UPI003F7638C6